MGIVLHDYWRSSAAFRVRIALHLKGVAFEARPVDLLKGEQAGAAYRAKNPQGLVPALEIDGHILTQSLAIIDYLDAKFPEPPMVSSDPLVRSATLARALVVAADIHPLNNLRVRKYLTEQLSQPAEAVNEWQANWIAAGFVALEQEAPEDGYFGGERPDLSDLCLVPQVYNARRLEMDLGRFPKLLALDERLMELPAFQAAAPAAPLA